MYDKKPYGGYPHAAQLCTEGVLRMDETFFDCVSWSFSKEAAC